MFTDQDVYNIAEWIANSRENMFINSDDKLEITKYIINATQNHFPEYNIDDIYAAFEDERVLLIIDFYYIKNNDKVH